ncbi:uncharacterized protein LOC143793655 [Ranitomeya variabilis]|uniref:uncharacterized protein LOC143793655 n=1 Tax=Ranitomeya variabilis TaxID=490064 RepID=UPI0040566E95
MKTRRTPEAAAAPSPGGRPSTSRGAAAVPLGWGTKAARESAVGYGSRIHAHLCEYEDASRKLKSLWGELRVAKDRSDRASGNRKAELSAAVKKIKQSIQDLESRRCEILDGSGPFREKLENDDRFRAMTGGAPEGSRSSGQVVEEDDEECEEEVAPYPPPGGLVRDLQASHSGIAPEQVALPSDSGPSGDSGSEGEDEDGGSSSEGGCLVMQQIRQIESPVRFNQLRFGDEICEDEATRRGMKRKAKKSKKKTSTVEKYVYVPLSGAPRSRCAAPATHPGSDSVVGPQRGSGEITGHDTQGAASVCGNGGGSDVSDMEHGVEGGPEVGKRVAAGTASPAVSAGVSGSPTYGSAKSGSLLGSQAPSKVKGEGPAASALQAHKKKMVGPPLAGSAVKSGSPALGAPPLVDDEGEWPSLGPAAGVAVARLFVAQGVVVGGAVPQGTGTAGGIPGGGSSSGSALGVPLRPVSGGVASSAPAAHVGAALESSAVRLKAGGVASQRKEKKMVLASNGAGTAADSSKGACLVGSPESGGLPVVGAPVTRQDGAGGGSAPGFLPASEGGDSVPAMVESQAVLHKSYGSRTLKETAALCVSNPPAGKMPPVGGGSSEPGNTQKRPPGWGEAYGS